MLTFEVIGKPQGKARARVTKWGAYTPDKTVLYENLIKMSFQQEYPKHNILEGYLKMRITAVFEPTKSTSKKNKEKMYKQEIRPAKKPDIDNIAKVVLDSLNSVAYKDDIQVVELICSKAYGVKERLIISICEV
jgi:Holliday junction resolvase RusA-like endonuclease